MPSLIGTTVAANYNRMTSQAPVRGTGALYSNFGTRQLRFVKVTAVTGNTGSTSAIDFSDVNGVRATETSTGALTAFSVAVRALQTVAEVMLIGTPGSAGFVAAISEDTVNDAGAVDNVGDGTYSVLEAAILKALEGGTDGAGTSAFASGTGRAVTVTGLTIGASNGITIA